MPYPVVFSEPEGNTAAIAAVTDGIEVLLTLHNSVGYMPLVTLLQNLFGFFFRDFAELTRSDLREYLDTGADNNLAHNRIITILKYLAACAGSQSYISGSIYYLFCLRSCQKIAMMPTPPIDISNAPY